MPYTKAYIPYGCYYSTPFVRWNGAIKQENSVELGATTARRWFVEKNIDPKVMDFLYFGLTIAQPMSFYGHVYSSAVIQNREKEVPALQVNQVCTTSATTLALAANDIELGTHEAVFTLATDRTSCTPLLVVPEPRSGSVVTENLVLDNFNRDPSPGAGLKMIQTAEAVAKEMGITREECDEIALLRYEQYADALKNNREFQKRYLFPIQYGNKKAVKNIEADEGITPTTKESLEQLKPVEPNGVLTFGTQTHPADGNAGIMVTSLDKAKELSKDAGITVQIISYGVLRVQAGRMAGAPAPALALAVKNAGLKISDLKQVKTHNPFIVNDVNLGKKLGLDQKIINNYGSSLVYGHPQGPTAGRAIIELIETLAMQGGGYGAFTGCAAGDVAASMVIKVN